MSNVSELIRSANPVPEANPLSDDEVNAVLTLTLTRSGNMDVKEIVTPVEPDKPKWNGWVVAAASFGVVVLVVGLALLLTRSTTEELPPATTPTTVAILTVDGALAVSDGFVEAFNRGDADAVMALFTSDVALSEHYIGQSPSFEAIDRAFFEQYLAWSTAQGTTFTSPECAVTDEGTAAAVTVSCEFGWLPAAEAAVGLPPIPTVLTMVVTRGGISQAAFEYLSDFGVGSFGSDSEGKGWFEAWVLANHADHMEGIEYGDWDSVAVAEQGGILLAVYVEEWAAFLETRG
jgi:hypothetical protein